MKKQFLLFLFLSSYFLLTAQNWSPLRLNDRYNYQLDSETYITNTIWIDSVAVLSTDSIFYLNRIVEDCFNCGQEPHEIKLGNQGQFLQKEMIKKADGLYHFNGEQSFVIDTDASINETWLFDTLQNVEATVINVEMQEVFGIMDSVKTIALSNQNTFKLSKNYGIIDFQNTSETFQLKGIEGREVGEIIPDFWSIYNFEVGDVFQYKGYNFGLAGINYFRFKHEILSKQILSNGYSYEVRRVQRDSHVVNQGPNVVNFNEQEITLNFIDTSINHTNQYNRQLIPDYYNGDDAFGCSSTTYQYMNVFRDSLDGKVTKQVGEFDVLFGSYIYHGVYEFLDDTDFLTSDIPFCFLNFFYIYKEGLGEVHKYREILDNAVKFELIGYVKGEDTTGTVIADEVLLLSNSELTLDVDIEISPNPSTGVFNIKNQASEDLSFQVLDIKGQLLWQKENPAFVDYLEIDLEKYPSGIYLLKVSDGKGIKTMKLMKY